MINYPVSADSRWSAVSGGAIIRSNFKWPRGDGGEIVGLDPAITLLLHVQAADPAFDPATHRLVQGAGVFDEAANTLTFTRTAVAIPQEELDDATELTQIRAVYLDLKNGVGTAGERITRVEKVLARMLKDQYGS